MTHPDRRRRGRAIRKARRDIRRLSGSFAAMTAAAEQAGRMVTAFAVAVTGLQRSLSLSIAKATAQETAQAKAAEQHLMETTP